MIAQPFKEGYEPNAMSSQRSSSVPAAANPFWSQGVQEDFQVQQMRPQALPAHAAPVPDDLWDDEESPKPIEGSKPSGELMLEGNSQPTVFETPPSGTRELAPTAPAEREAQQMGGDDAQMEPQQPEKAARWRGRNAAVQKTVAVEHSGLKSESKMGSGLTEALGDEVIKHFQREAIKLQETNARLVQELHDLKREKEQQKPPVPSSWQAPPSVPKTPPRMEATPHVSTGQWMSPLSSSDVKYTPNGTRVPSGPPPASPPPLPAWPVALEHYEVSEQPRKRRGIMGDPVFRPKGESLSPRAKNFWLEQQVEDLRDMLHQQAAVMGQPPLSQCSYFNKPFLTGRQREQESRLEVARMMRNAGVPQVELDAQSGLLDGRDNRAQHDRASQQRQELGDVCPQDRALHLHEHGGEHDQDRASLHVLGGEPHQDRAPVHVLGGEGL